eukprot:2216576-Rhodomonas_salina.1
MLKTRSKDVGRMGRKIVKKCEILEPSCVEVLAPSCRRGIFAKDSGGCRCPFCTFKTEVSKLEKAERKHQIANEQMVLEAELTFLKRLDILETRAAGSHCKLVLDGNTKVAPSAFPVSSPPEPDHRLDDVQDFPPLTQPGPDVADAIVHSDLMMDWVIIGARNSQPRTYRAVLDRSKGDFQQPSTRPRPSHGMKKAHCRLIRTDGQEDSDHLLEASPSTEDALRRDIGAWKKTRRATKLKEILKQKAWRMDQSERDRGRMPLFAEPMQRWELALSQNLQLRFVCWKA